MMKRNKTLLILIFLIALLPGCRKQLSPNDALTLQRVRDTIIPFITDHAMDHWQYPESLAAMKRAGLHIPENPYTNEPMIDTGSPEFDPEISPGNIHYVPVRDQAGQIGNFSVHVFGEKGELRHIRPSPMAAG